MKSSARLEKFPLVLVCASETNPVTYSLETTAHLVGVHPELLRYYCQSGFFGAARARAGAELSFDDDALYELRRFEHYRRHHGVDRQTLRLIFELRREVERLQAEVRFLRGP